MKKFIKYLDWFTLGLAIGSIIVNVILEDYNTASWCFVTASLIYRCLKSNEIDS